VPNLNVGLVAAVVMGIFASCDAWGLIQSILAENCLTTIRNEAAKCTKVSGTSTVNNVTQYQVTECQTCKTGYELSTVYMATGCGAPISVPVDTCVEIETEDECDSDADCEPTGYIMQYPITDGYDYTRLDVCNDPDSTTSTCSTEYSFSCAAGYYGHSSDIECEFSTSSGTGGLLSASFNCSAGCTQCPSARTADSSVVLAGTTPASVVGIYDCSIGPIDGMMDQSGMYSYEEACNYTDTCANVTGVCNSLSGTQYQIINGTKTEEKGTKCWCNVVDENKNFFYQNFSIAGLCSLNCPKLCKNAVATNADLRSDLGCE